MPAAAAAWADEFDTQQRQQGPSMWGEEFAAFQAQQHPAATGEQWAADFEGEDGCTLRVWLWLCCGWMVAAGLGWQPCLLSGLPLRHTVLQAPPTGRTSLRRACWVEAPGPRSLQTGAAARVRRRDWLGMACMCECARRGCWGLCEDANSRVAFRCLWILILGRQLIAVTLLACLPA